MVEGAFVEGGERWRLVPRALERELVSTLYTSSKMTNEGQFQILQTFLYYSSSSDELVE